MRIVGEIGVILLKEFKIELKNRYAFNSIVLYLGGVVFTAYMSFELNAASLTPTVWNALLWIVMLFIAITAINKSFSLERHERNYYYYYLHHPISIILAKIIYNVILMSIIGGMCYGAFRIFLVPGTVAPGAIYIRSEGVFLANLLIGCVAFAANLSMVAAIASKTNNPTLMAVMSFPLILPLLMLLIRVSTQAMLGLGFDILWKDMTVALAMVMLVLTISILIFPYLWRTV